MEKSTGGIPFFTVHGLVPEMGAGSVKALRGPDEPRKARLKPLSYLLPAAPPSGKNTRSNSYQRCSVGTLDHNGCCNLIIDAVAAVLDHHDAHFTFTGNNRDFLATVAS